METNFISPTFDVQNELPVMEYFYTIQGEGFHQGKAAFFIRLAGCNVGCVWCDVKESWNAELHPPTIAGCVTAFHTRVSGRCRLPARGGGQDGLPIIDP